MSPVPGGARSHMTEGHTQGAASKAIFPLVTKPRPLLMPRTATPPDTQPSRPTHRQGHPRTSLSPRVQHALVGPRLSQSPGGAWRRGTPRSGPRVPWARQLTALPDSGARSLVLPGAQAHGHSLLAAPCPREAGSPATSVQGTITSKWLGPTEQAGPRRRSLPSWPWDLPLHRPCQTRV